MTEQKRPLVVYHADCIDGFTAAYAAWVRLRDQAEYVPAHYGDKPVEEVDGREVYLLDFSYPRAVIEELRRRAARVMVIDHHQTAAANLEGLEDCIFDQEHSGAYLAWRYFHPERPPMPDLVLAVEDRDLWRFQLPETAEVHAGLGTLPRTFESWAQVAFDLGVAVVPGRVALCYEQALIETLLKKRSEIVLDGHKTWAVNSPVLISELGEAVANLPGNHAPMGVVYSIVGDQVRVSLRSVGDFDVSAIAARRGGGGHRNAAGCEVPLRDWLGLLG